MQHTADKKIRFQGKEYLLIGGDLERGGAITTPEDFRNFTASYAHLKANGDVMRFGDTIGHRDEIEVLAEVPQEEPTLEKALDAILDPAAAGWVRP